jgi:hypothetical protein
MTWRMNFTVVSSRDNLAKWVGGLMVGLTRIELVTSSLSGMRSNRLSYSPMWGLLTLPLGRAWLNRPSHHFFFKHCDPDSADQFGDQIEDNGTQDP